VGPAADTQLHEGISQVVLDRLWADDHTLGDLSIGESFGDEASDGLFTIR
jgi:hypothetical protein